MKDDEGRRQKIRGRRFGREIVYSFRGSMRVRAEIALSMIDRLSYFSYLY